VVNNSIDPLFWKGKRVFLTGHTGFKGGWASVWLNQLGAELYGYALEPETDPSLFKTGALEGLFQRSYIADIRDRAALKTALEASRPDIIIHMAAQPLVRESYINPYDTFDINIMGTVNLLESVREQGGVRAFLNVTTDKVYENKEWDWGYREYEPLGGYDPYSASKAGSEIVTSSYRSSFFNPKDHGNHKMGLATARSGNVIGGGDWSKDRLIPDCIKAFTEGREVVLRNPVSTRPWQHVLEPVSGYLRLVENLYKQGEKYSKAYNFGPENTDNRTVLSVVEKLVEHWPGDAEYKVERNENDFHEAKNLTLDISLSKSELKWWPKWNMSDAVRMTALWYDRFLKGDKIADIITEQVKEYQET